ncbi:hypothetical protein [Halobacillus salinus]|nr:hypothetical protein [Halobacillus salinus]
MNEVAPDFVEIGQQIDKSLYEQPDSALIQARLYGEHLGKLVSKQEKLEQAYEIKHVDRLHKLWRSGVIEDEIHQKFDWIRKKGNKSAHEAGSGDVESAIRAHRTIYDLSVWYVQLYVSFDFDVPAYEVPKPKADPAIDQESLAGMLQPLLDESLQSVVGKQWQEMKKEIEELKKVQTPLQEAPSPAPEPQPEKKQPEPEEPEEEPFGLFRYLEDEHGLEVLDKRPYGGTIWVVGDWAIKDALFALKEHKFYFRFAKKGSKSTKKRPAWFMMNKWKETKEQEQERLKNAAKAEPSADKAPQETPQPVTAEEKVDTTEAEAPVKDIPETPWTTVTFRPVAEIDHIDHGQIRIPSHRDDMELAAFGHETMEHLAERYSVRTFSDLSEEVLRSLYKEDKEMFHHTIQLFYALGVRFNGALAQFQPVSALSEDQYLFVEGDGARRIAEWMPKTYAARLDEVGIDTGRTLSGTPLSSLEWLFKDLYPEVLTFFQRREETEMKPEPNSVPHDSERTITFGSEQLFLSVPLQSMSLDTDHFHGMNNLIQQLNADGCTTVRDLPSDLETLKKYNSVGPGIIKKLWGQLVDYSQAPTQEEEETLPEGVIAFEGEQVYIPEEVRELPIGTTEFTAVNPIVRQFDEQGIGVFGDLLDKFDAIPSWKGVGKRKVRAFLEQLKTVIEAKGDEIEHQELIESMTPEELREHRFRNVETNIDSVIQSESFRKRYKINDRYLEIIKHKHEEFLQGNNVTLQMMGDMMGVTRERVRQILKVGHERLLPLTGGWLDELTKRLETEVVIDNSWLDRKRTDHYIIGEILQSQGVSMEKDDSVMTTLSSEAFDDLEHSIRKEFESHFSLRTFGQPEIDEWVQKQSESWRRPASLYVTCTKGLVRWADGNTGVLSSHNKRDIVEMVMKQLPDGVEVYKDEEELIRRANRLMPGKFGGERSFAAIASRDDQAHIFYLWGRGAYIHEQFVDIPHDWIARIQQEALKELEGVPMVNIQKLFNAHEKEAIERGIPNEYALYTLMRRNPIQGLSYPKFPKVAHEGVEWKRNKEWIRDFIAENGGVVSTAELKEEFIVKHGWKDFTLQHNLSSDDEIIQYKHAQYTLLSNYHHITAEDYRNIIDQLDEMLEEQPVVQIGNIFDEKKVYLSGLGVESTYLLYATLKNVYDGPHLFPRYPYVTREDIEDDEVSVRSLVEEYLRSAGAEVPREELHEWVTTEIGGHDRIVDHVLQQSEDMFFYTRGRNGEYVHRDVIGWDETKKEQLHEYLLEETQKVLHKNGNAVVTIEDIFSPSGLPELDNGIPWTEDLLTDCIRRDDRWKTIGSFHWIISTPHLDFPFDDNKGFVAYVLDNEFGGSVKRRELMRYLESISYSKEGDFLHEVWLLIEDGQTAFSVEGDEVIMKHLKEERYE